MLCRSNDTATTEIYTLSLHALEAFLSPDLPLMPRMRAFNGPDDTTWGVEVQNPGASNAVVVFRHPDGQTGRFDRYAWYISRGSESQNVTGRLNKRAVLDSLGDADLQRLFRRSMPVSTDRSPATDIG